MILSAEFRLCLSLNIFSLWQGLLNLLHPEAIKEDELFWVKLASMSEEFPWVPWKSWGSSPRCMGGYTVIKNLVLPSQWLRWWLALVFPGSLKSSFCEPFLPILLAFYPKTLCQTRRKGGKEKVNNRTLKQRFAFFLKQKTFKFLSASGLSLSILLSSIDSINNHTDWNATAPVWNSI